MGKTVATISKYSDFAKMLWFGMDSIDTIKNNYQ